MPEPSQEQIQTYFPPPDRSAMDDGAAAAPAAYYAYPYCDSSDPIWNTSYSWHTNHPDFTPCFHMTFLAVVPCAFMLLSFPFHFHRLRSTNRGLLPRSYLHAGKVVAIVFMLVLTLVDVGVTIWQKLNTDRIVAPVYIVTPIILHIALCLAGTCLNFVTRYRAMYIVKVTLTMSWFAPNVQFFFSSSRDRLVDSLRTRTRLSVFRLYVDLLVLARRRLGISATLLRQYDPAHVLGRKVLRN